MAATARSALLQRASRVLGAPLDQLQVRNGIVSVRGAAGIVSKTVSYGDLVGAIDLDDTRFNKTTIFNFAAHRRIEHYGLITARTEAVPPPE